MESYTFKDALTGSTVSFDWPGLQALMVRGAGDASALEPCETLFFPGCSYINYAMPLVQSVSDLLSEAGVAQGVSLLCCGKILSYEPNGKELRASFEDDLRDHVAAAGVKRIVAACPNCVKALRAAFAEDERTADVEIVPLPAVLAELGYAIDGDAAREMLREELTQGSVAYEVADALEPAGAPDAPDAPDAGDLFFSVHDSCPDRDLGEFADGVRALLPDDLVREMEHNRHHSSCCGSLVRAAGKWEAADKQAQRRGAETREAGAQGIVTSCISCAFQLSMAERAVPVFHYLELLYNWRVNWVYMDAWMKLRFLFDENLGVDEVDEDARRAFAGL